MVSCVSSSFIVSRQRGQTLIVAVQNQDFCLGALRVVRSGRWAERKHRLRLARRRAVQRPWPLDLGGRTSERGSPGEAEAALALALLRGARLELEVAVRTG